MGEDAGAVSAKAWDQVVSVLGKPGHCRYVDRAAQSVVKRALKNQAGAHRVDSTSLRRDAGDRADRVCTAMTAEGRTLLVVLAGTAVTLYTILRHKQVDDEIVEAVRNAQIPLKIPIPPKYGQLKAMVGFDAPRLEWQIKRGDVGTKILLEESFRGGGSRVAGRVYGALPDGQGRWELSSSNNGAHEATVARPFARGQASWELAASSTGSAKATVQRSLAGGQEWNLSVSRNRAREQIEASVKQSFAGGHWKIAATTDGDDRHAIVCQLKFGL